MCNECKKLLELFAETQLECLKKKKSIRQCIASKCDKCGEDVFIVAEIIDDTIIISDPILNEKIKKLKKQ